MAVILENQWVGEGRERICVCGHRLDRHANPHYGSVSHLVLTDRCLECDGCSGFRMFGSKFVLHTDRIARLANLDSRTLAGRPHSLGPGGASAIFARAVEQALRDEIADQLRGSGTEDGNEISEWAAGIVDAFSEPKESE
jgi:hypothetical protein